MKSISLATAALWTLMSLAVAAGQPSAATQAPPRDGKGVAALDAAAKAHKYLFIFFWNAQNQQTNSMQGVFQAATAKLTDRADAIAIQVGDPAEKPLVDSFDVSRAPLPLVLAIAPNGVATRAFTLRLEEGQLQQAFVSPCTAQCMKAIHDRHLILLCVQNGKTQANDAAMQGVRQFKADPQFDAATEVVTLNPADRAEADFLKALQVDPQTPTAVTLLVAPPGAPIARFDGPVTKDEIAAKLAAAQSGCCPGGKCGPGGCCPPKK